METPLVRAAGRDTMGALNDSEADASESMAIRWLRQTDSTSTRQSGKTQQASEGRGGSWAGGGGAGLPADDAKK